MAESTESATNVQSGRRGFVQLLTAVLSGLLGLIPAGIGAAFILDPLVRKRTAKEADSGDDSADLIPLPVSADMLPADGTPVSVVVKSDKVDAWNRFKDIEIGTVWLRKDANGDVVAFSSICPHLGCAVDFRPGNRDFFCPCHTSSFGLDGERTNQIPPRGMDQLDVVVKPEADNQLWIKYESFRAGTPEKIKVT